jgi:2,3-dihydroxyphenylpropionate 1,2-dioxygenase
MSLIFAGICSHAPGITGRALVLVGAEHFANFFMDNMPAYAIGMADEYEGPIEDPAWLGIAKTRIPGNAGLGRRIVTEVMETADVAFAEEWRFDHGLIVPLHFLTPRFDLDVIPVNINCQGPPLTPLHRVWTFGEALRRAADKVPERIAIVATGGISHWPATPDSGKINEAWDREFMARWQRNDKTALLSYRDADIYREAGQGGFEIRTFVSLAAAARGQGAIRHFQPIPIFSVSATIGVMEVK